jgi:prepilin-type N-terminal cleavage/methylation domain-containing protein
MDFFKKQKIYSSNNKGFTLIEVLVGTVIFVLVALSAYKAFGVLMDGVSVARAKVAATSIANEKFEIIRNLPYSDVGIVGGLPVGKIARNQTIVRDNYSFNIVTAIRSIDDPFDGTIGGNPNDLSPADYKMADLDISCSNCKYPSMLNFTTLVAPHALESTSTNGALFIRAFNFAGTPVSGASVHIVNTQTNPDTVIDETTDNDGWLKIVDAIVGTNAYNITVTKPNYSQDQTYPIGGVAGPTPVKPDATVVTRQVTQLSFAIDTLSSLNISSVDNSCVALPNIPFTLSGAKLIGTPSVLKYTQTFTTNGDGNQNVSNLEWDSYSISPSGSNYDVAGTIPITPLSLNPSESKSIEFIAVAHSNRALLVSVKTSTGVAIDGATVRLKKSGFDQTKTTTSVGCSGPGQVFWNGLGTGNYTLTVSKTGYQTSTSTVTVSSSPTWQQKNVPLTPQ